jgi:NADH dehydrogenase
VTVKANCAVEEISLNRVVAGGEAIPTALAIWAAGVRASPLGALLGVPTDKSGRVRTNRDLSVAGLANVYALGDVALVLDAGGKPLPGLAQVAKQEGRYLGRELAKNCCVASARRRLSEFPTIGNAAIIGRRRRLHLDGGAPRDAGMAVVGICSASLVVSSIGCSSPCNELALPAYDHGARLIVKRSQAPTDRA